MSNRKLIVGNWKLNPPTIADARRIAQKTRRVAADLKRTETVVCPPFVFLTAAASRKKASNFHLGAQSVSAEENGAHTGEVSAAMLKDIGVEYVIVGHSEERVKGDTDLIVSKRLKMALEGNMTAILCVGEKSRDGDGAYLEALKDQLKKSCEDIPKTRARNIIVAYEPVWAIGAKEAMKPEEIYETSLFVKKTFADIFGSDVGVKVPVLYGGAVHYRNAADIMKIGKVDGLLIGRESVNLAGFIELLRAVDGVN